VLMGNVQTSVLQEVDGGPIRRSVRTSMTHGKPGGRFIFSSSHQIMLDEYEKPAYYPQRRRADLDCPSS
jgi:hypothetical protein